MNVRSVCSLKSHIRGVVIVALTLTAFLILPGSALAGQGRSDLIVRYRTGFSYSLSQFNNNLHGIKTDNTVGGTGALGVSIVDGKSVSAKVLELRLDPAVEYAEPNYTLRALVTTPNDPYYLGSSYPQWNLRIAGADYAWDTWRGSSSVIIAILDTGVATTHPDLSAKIVAGYDFVSNDSNPTDENGHGTHVAGIAAASTNNGTGVAGVDWNARIMPVRVLDATGSGSSMDVADGIYWAADHGAKVINMSLGDTSYSQTVQDAIDYAYAAGVTVVAAAGNSGNNVPMYPASGANVISVAATDSSDNRASFSNYNAYVDIAAPGATITSTYWDSTNGNCYGVGSGTSMATPHVAGLAALVASRNPTWSPDRIETAIETTATDKGTPGRDNYYGYGRIDIDAAVDIGTAVDHFTVTAGAVQIAGTVFPLTVTAKDSSNSTITSFVSQVTISDTTGTVSPTTSGSFSAGVWTGNVRVTKTGTDYISVSGGVGATGTSAAIVVNPGALNAIVVSPANVSVNVTQTQAFAATAYDAYNNVIAGQSFSWSATGGTVNPPSGTGTTYTAGSTPGASFSVSAAASGRTGSVAIRVIGPLDHIHVSGAASEVIEGQTVGFSALGNDAAHNAIAGLSYNWTATGGTVNPASGTGGTTYTAGLVLGNYLVTAANGQISGTAAIEVIPTPVRRFYNFRQGVHFYTTNNAEYLNVLNNCSWTYRYEGISFRARSTQVSGTIPVYRFYNFLQGVHFYTANAAEADNVRRTATWTFRDEGIAYYAYASPQSQTIPVYRFYNFLQGSHFYTANASEADGLKRTATWTYRYEGISYYVPDE